MTTFLSTLWGLDTVDGHDLEIVHRALQVTTLAEAAAAQRRVRHAHLHDDGRLTCSVDDVDQVVDPADVIKVLVYVRPHAERGKPFLPDMTTEEGRARIKATLTDPAYVTQPDDYHPCSMSLTELAALRGATGRLQSLAYGIVDLAQCDDVSGGAGAIGEHRG